MNNHYTPRLLIKQFATSKKVNVYNFKTLDFNTMKVKHVFSSKNLFDPELETTIATNIEGPFGDLLNHKLLLKNTILIDRRENMILRKFFMINSLRNPIFNQSWDELVKNIRLENHPSIKATEFLNRYHPELKKIFEEEVPSMDNYIQNLKKTMAINSIEDFSISSVDSLYLNFKAEISMATTLTFWDSEDTGQEFILPKFPGVTQMDHVSIFYKLNVLDRVIAKIQKDRQKEYLINELNRIKCGTSIFFDNFSIYPISPTRLLIAFSPYFRTFFSIKDPINTKEIYPVILGKDQFDKHFFESVRMELFEPCINFSNKHYKYSVKKLKKEEVLSINALMLDMETEAFVFRDYNKIRDSFWYYDKIAKFALGKKHDFSLWI